MDSAETTSWQRTDQVRTRKLEIPKGRQTAKGQEGRSEWVWRSARRAAPQEPGSQLIVSAIIAAFGSYSRHRLVRVLARPSSQPLTTIPAGR
jgi:hypothetical protein